MSGNKSQEFVIPPPPEDKPPLKVNVYLHMQLANTQLAPLFPYHGEGDIVPLGTIHQGGSGLDHGFFQHTNSVDEVSLCWGSDGSRARPGLVRVGARTHGVGAPGQDDPEFFALMTNSQRQAEGEVQWEVMRFLCGNCQHELFRLDFPANMRAVAESGAGPGFADFHHFPPLSTIEGAERAAVNYNADEAIRRCPECGYENNPFPRDVWGWWHYMKHTQIIEKARDTLDHSGGYERGES